MFANGDARAAYNTLEVLARAAAPNAQGRRSVTEDLLSQTLQRKFLLYDKSGEEHFNLISAFHKSVRNSDADAALYWLARMLESGEDPLYVARRLVRMASEDIGLADPAALGIAIAAMQAADFVGAPEGNLALAQAAVYLALAPKSNALYTGYGEAPRRSFQHGGRACAAAPAQRRHRSHEASGIRPRLRVRPRRPGKDHGHGVPARKFDRAEILPAHRSRFRAAPARPHGGDSPDSRPPHSGTTLRGQAALARRFVEQDAAGHGGIE